MIFYIKKTNTNNTSNMNFDKNQYKVYTWKNWMMLHWILNPGLMVNELILGQRVPKISLEDKTSNKPRIERSFVPCPHCDTLHDGRTWSQQNKTGFQNWFGLYCPNCGNIIPCLLNIFSFIVLAITFPIWGWFRTSSKNKWIEKQPQRFQAMNIEKTPNPFDNKNWIKTGLSWGIFMFLMMTIVFPYLFNEAISTKSIVLGAVIWSIGGLAFGYTMKLSFNSKNTKKA